MRVDILSLSENAPRHLIATPELEYFRSLNWLADQWAISTASQRALEVFARLASKGRHNYAELRRSILRSETSGHDYEYLSRLARIVAVRNGNADDVQFALEAFRIALANLPFDGRTKRVRSIAFELALTRGDYKFANEVLTGSRDLQSEFFRYRESDLLNPFIDSDSGDHGRWLKSFNAPFEHYQLAPIQVNGNNGNPFERVSISTESREALQLSCNHSILSDNPLVSVILTTYNPCPSELVHSVKSILNQTWKNIELLVIDDASTHFPEEDINELAHSDPRLKLLRMEQNGGTYRARNYGLSQAQGFYVTGQDTDDWSHPQRIEVQLGAIHGKRDVAGVLGTAIRTNENLVRTTLGFTPNRRCEVSLMCRTSDARAIGGYLPLRKAADSEFRERLQLVTKRDIVILDHPLYLTRLSASSLSRSEFRHGWTDMGRLMFTSSFRFWHSELAKRATVAEVSDRSSDSPVYFPTKLTGVHKREMFDVCFVADWRVESEIVRSALDEIASLLEGGLRVAIVQMPSPFSYGAVQRKIVSRIQKLINAGKISLLLEEDEATVDLLVVRDPAVIVYKDDSRFKSRFKRCIVVAEDPWVASSNGLRRYATDEIEHGLFTGFRAEGEWKVPESLSPDKYAYSIGLERTIGVYPSVVRMKPRNWRPNVGEGSYVRIGMELRPVYTDLPLQSDCVKQFLSSNKVDFYILGRSDTHVRSFGSKRPPLNWVNFPSNELMAKDCLTIVDAVAALDVGHTWVPPRRFILEALANGVPVLSGAKSQHRDIPGVVQAVDSEFLDTFHDMRGFERVPDSITIGQKWVNQRYDPSRYVYFIRRILAEVTKEP